MSWYGYASQKDNYDESGVFLAFLELRFDEIIVKHPVCLDIWDADAVTAKGYRGVVCESSRVEPLSFDRRRFCTRRLIEGVSNPYQHDVKVGLPACLVCDYRVYYEDYPHLLIAIVS